MTRLPVVRFVAAYMYPSIYLGLYPDGRVGPGKDGSLSNTLDRLIGRRREEDRIQHNDR